MAEFEQDFENIIAKRHVAQAMERLQSKRERGASSATDHLDALTDYLRLAAGRSVSDPHPLAEIATRDGVPLKTFIARCVGVAPDELDGVRFNRAMLSDPVAFSLETASQHVLTESFATAREHRALLRDLQVSNLMATAIASIDVGTIDKLPQAGGPLPVPELTFTEVNDSTSLVTFAAQWVLGRTTIINADPGAIMSIPAAVGGAIARAEAKLLYSLLAANPNVAGTPLIDTDNTIDGGIISVTVLDAAGEKLRTLSGAGGEYRNTRPALLLVPASAEFSAAAALASMVSGSKPRLRLVASPWVEKAAYLMGAPETDPVFVRLVLGKGEPSVSNMGSTGDMDGNAWRMLHNVGVTAVSRDIVKIKLTA